ncbi:MAG: L,D-transpeptidase [Hyphomicrobiaceae bacterium]
MRLSSLQSPERTTWTGPALAILLALGFLATANATPANAASRIVPFKADYPMGSILIVNNQRKLYYVLGNGKAIRYPVAVGNRREIWTGKIFVQSKRKNPSWRHPDGGQTVPGGPGNPLGVRALYLGWTLWRIHGTPNTRSIGSAVSNGCIRMYNSDVKDLYERVHIGAPVYVIKSMAHAGTALGPARKLYGR